MQAGAVGVHDPDVQAGAAGAGARERELLAVWRPRRLEVADAAKARFRRHLSLVAPVGIHHPDPEGAVAPLVRDPRAVGRPGRRLLEDARPAETLDVAAVSSRRVKLVVAAPARA